VGTVAAVVADEEEDGEGGTEAHSNVAPSSTTEPKSGKEAKNQPPWLTIVLALLGVASAISVALIQTCGKRKDEPQREPAAGKDEATSGATRPATGGASDCVPLLWTPSKCAGSSTPGIAIGTCADPRTLEWLSGELKKLRRAELSGFKHLAEDPRPRPEDGKKRDDTTVPNQKLVVDGQGNRQYLVGVGYNYERDSDDGYLRLYDRLAHLQSDPVCYTGKGWKVQHDGNWLAVK
jgi:hypothetical protein